MKKILKKIFIILAIVIVILVFMNARLAITRVTKNFDKTLVGNLVGCDNNLDGRVADSEFRNLGDSVASVQLLFRDFKSAGNFIDVYTKIDGIEYYKRIPDVDFYTYTDKDSTIAYDILKDHKFMMSLLIHKNNKDNIISIYDKTILEKR